MSMLSPPFPSRRRRFSAEVNETLSTLFGPAQWQQGRGSFREATEVSVTFQVEACVKPGNWVVLTGSPKELGLWEGQKAVRLMTSAMTFPTWISQPVTFFVTGDTFEFEYKFAEMSPDSFCLESFSGNRSLQFNTKMVRTMKFVSECVFNTPTALKVNSCEGFSLLLALDPAQTLAVNVATMVSYMRSKAANATLKDFLSISFFFQTCSTFDCKQHEDDTVLCAKMRELMDALLAVATAEVSPIIHKTVIAMSHCCLRFRRQMKSIADPSLVRSGKLSLGCRSQDLEDLLDEFFDSSPRSAQAILRVIALNSIRRVLQKVRTKQQALVRMYECWLLQLQEVCIEKEILSGKEVGLETMLDEVAVIAESLALSHVCPQVQRIFAALPSMENLFCVRESLVHLIEAGTMWLSQYLHAAEKLGKKDYICIRNFLIEIGAESVRQLFPVVIRALTAVCARIGLEVSLGVCTGRAVGKVLIVDSLEEVPNDFSSVIAVVRSSCTREILVPSNVTGIVHVGDCYICSQLVAHCLHHGIVLGVISRLEAGVEGKVEVRIDTDTVVFL